MPATQVVAAVEPDAGLREAFCKDFGLPVYATLRRAAGRAARPDIAAIFLPHADCPAAAEACARARRPPDGREAHGRQRGRRRADRARGRGSAGVQA